MATTVLPFHDAERGRALPTTVYAPDEPGPHALVVFCHGFYGHPRKFTRLFAAWAAAGFVVAAPAFPLTNDETADPPVFDDVVNQPADVRFVIDELLRSPDVGELVDPRRIGLGGFSMGGVTALAVGFHVQHHDDRVRAVASLAGGFWERFGESYAMTSVPLLLVHGDRDSTAPYAASEAAYQAARPPKMFATMEDADHNICEDTGLTDVVLDLTMSFWDAFLHADTRARAALTAERSGTTVRSDGI